ncbi:type IV-A pilus assembly ATPase PilB [Cysteiniphilum sp. JM-1]|uniref:type IV-A pilus assembly ATPase PilB n=1 Tax=Cysteiniphilum sp. JM-1 TaxID=2610891 RepID=UPI00124622CC|nr:type IV-A pilus assembly ATPase PilB [Cysteiniphilum sp. JM-1]
MTQHGISSFLLSQNLINNDDLEQAIDEIDNSNEPLITHLINKKLLDANAFAIESSQFFNLPLFDLNAYDLDFFPRAFLDERLINDYVCLPLYKKDNTLLLATSDPLNLNAVREFRFFSNLDIEQIIVDDTHLRRFIKEVTENTTDNAMKTLEGMDLEEIDLDIVETDDFEDDDDFGDNDEPVIKYINKIIVDAINKGASDIHFEPYATNFRIRYRIDGLLQEIATPPLKIAARTAARIKIMSQLNIAEKRIPQDGRFKLKISKTHVIDFRVSTCPTAFGEKVVLRILDQAKTNLSVDKLGFEPHQQEIYLAALKQSQGMILVTGPTGSGKTVTLYTGLHIINTIDKNISTAEDPVEINVNGINQVQINNKQGLTFARALKSFLRQDPDIIMIGEIRDFETADIAIKAAQTGHLVLSTVHTNSAPETLNRLLDMGIPHYNIISSVSLIIAQRLARKLCPHCKKPAPDITRELLLDMGIRPVHVEKEFTAYTNDPQGCARCFKGFRGRVAIYEVMPLSLAMSRLIVEGRSTLTLAEQAQREGIDNLQQSALIKVVHGVTSIEEAHRVTSM